MEKRVRQIFYQSTVETEISEDIDILLESIGFWHILLHNDEVNTFDWVIDCLMKICDHTQEQAEQCAWFVHFNGQYVVKVGAREDLKPLCESLQEKGLSAVLIKSE